MRKDLVLFTKRYIQITMVFVLFKYLELYWHIPRNNWISITGAMIYMGFNPGKVIKRAYLRFTGTLIGIAAVAIVWHLVHIDYRLAIFFLVIICWAMIFFQGLSYEYYTIIGIVFSDINFELSNTFDFSLQYYLLNRFFTTIIVFGVCIVVEQIYFSKSNLSILSCQHLLQKIEEELWLFFRTACSKKITQAALLKKIMKNYQNLLELKELMDNLKHENKVLYIQSQTVVINIQHIIRKIVCLGHLQLNHDDNIEINSLIEEIQQELQNKKISDLI